MLELFLNAWLFCCYRGYIAPPLVFAIFYALIFHYLPLMLLENGDKGVRADLENLPKVGWIILAS